MTNSSPLNLATLLQDLEAKLELYLVKKAPVLPSNIKEGLVKYSPYVFMVIVFMTLPSILLALGLGALLAPFTFLIGVKYSHTFSMASLFMLVYLVLYIMAIPGLFARQHSGWKKIFIATLLAGVYAFLNFDIIYLFFGTTISLYLLFQVKSYYKN